MSRMVKWRLRRWAKVWRAWRSGGYWYGIEVGDGVRYLGLECIRALFFFHGSSIG